MVTSLCIAVAAAMAMALNCRFSIAAPVILIFGDSTVDTGNRKLTASGIQVISADHAPYGQDFQPPGPTGRYSNGKIPTDFIASALGIQPPVEFYSAKAKGPALLNGVNFAMGGSGYLESTGSIPLSAQVSNLEQVQKNLSSIIGPDGVRKWTNSAIFFISTGDNDLVQYNINPLNWENTADQFNNMLITNAVQSVTRLYNLGARKIFFVSAGPVGCVPIVLALYRSSNGSCVKSLNNQTMLYNAALRSALHRLSIQLQGSHISYGDAYTPLFNAISGNYYGFKRVNQACCGWGSFGGLPPCLLWDVCNNVSDYVFWDSIHPTQAMYKIISDGLYAGSLGYPLNVQQMSRLP